MFVGCNLVSDCELRWIPTSKLGNGMKVRRNQAILSLERSQKTKLRHELLLQTIFNFMKILQSGATQRRMKWSQKKQTATCDDKRCWNAWPMITSRPWTPRGFLYPWRDARRATRHTVLDQHTARRGSESSLQSSQAIVWVCRHIFLCSRISLFSVCTSPKLNHLLPRNSIIYISAY